MKKSHIVVFLLNLFYCVSAFGQSTTIIDTKDLVSMSRRDGLSSVLHLIRKIPVSNLDSMSYYSLVKEVVNSEPSRSVSAFFTEYILTHYDETFKDDVFEYFSKEKELIKDYKSLKYGHLPKIEDGNLLSLVRYSDSRTEGLLCDYYREWLTKAKGHIEDYNKGEKEEYGIKDRLQQPMKDCHENCFKLLKALDLIKSTFPDSIKYKSHTKYLSRYDMHDLRFYTHDRGASRRMRYPVDTIRISSPFKTIGEVDLKNNKDFIRLIEDYNNENSWCYLVYNGRVGYLDIGAHYGSLNGSGYLYWFELIDDMIIVHEIYQWIS